MPEYNSPNGFGDSASSGSEADVEPSSEQIDAWNSDEGHAPSHEDTGDQESHEETETPEQDNNWGDEPEPEPVKEPVKKGKQQDNKQKLSPLQEHRLQKQWNKEKNELHKQLRIQAKQLRDFQKQVERSSDEMKWSPEEWEQLAQQLDSDGRYQEAQQARAQAQRSAQARQQFQSREQFEERWRANEREIEEQDPSIFQEGTETQKRLKALFENKELAARYLQNSDGIWAAYHRVKLEEAQELIPKLVKAFEIVQAENEKLKRGSSPLASTPGRRSAGDKSVDDMSLDELEAAAMREANAIDSGRR